jgi:hypothetical protein
VRHGIATSRWRVLLAMTPKAVIARRALRRSNLEALAGFRETQ